MKPLHYHPDARAEIDEAHLWYRRDSLQASDGFLEELIPAIDRVQSRPGTYTRYLHGTQRLVLQHYPYSIVFRERLHDIQIVAIAHASRRPGYWAGRLKH